MSVMAMMVTNAILQAVNGMASRQSSSSLQAKQMELQEALQKRQWEQSSTLQRELQEANIREARLRQQETMENQQRLAQDQAFRATWPLQVLPHVIHQQMMDWMQSSSQLPLYIIISSSSSLNQQGVQLGPLVKNTLLKIAHMLGTHYGLNSDSPVQCYVSDKEIDAQGVSNIFEVFKSCPTMVVCPQCIGGSHFSLSCHYWGVGDSSRPRYTEILSCDIKVMHREELRRIGREWPEKRELLQLDSDPVKDKLAELVRREDETLSEKKQLGATEEELSLYVQPSFDKEYNDKEILSTFGPHLNKLMGDSITAACNVSIPLLADSYYLLEHRKSPKLLSICHEEVRRFPELLPFASNFFGEIVHQYSGQSYLPLMLAQLAQAYRLAGHEKESLKLYESGVDKIKELLPPQEGYSWLLLPEFEQGIKALSEMAKNTDCNPLSEYNHILGCTSEDLNRLAVESYKKNHLREACGLWHLSAEKGNSKAAYNLAQIYENVPDRRIDAAKYYLQAFSGGYHKPEKIYFSASQLTKRGEWSDAFVLWVHLLTIKEYASDAASISSLFVLTTAVDKVSHMLQQEWARLVASREGLSIPPNLKNLALDCLAIEEQKGNKWALYALQGVGHALWGNSSTCLLAGCQDGGHLVINAEELDAVKCEFVKYMEK